MKTPLMYVKNFSIGLLILFLGLFIVPTFSVGLFLGISNILAGVEVLDYVLGEKLMVYIWILSLLLSAGWPFVAFIVWVFRDSKKVRLMGFKISPTFWAIGMLFPFILVTFPLYFAKRSTVWVKKHQNMQKEKMPFGVKFVIALVFSVSLVSLGTFLMSYIGIKNQKYANTITSSALPVDCRGVKGCSELRPLPKILNGKKIVFSESSAIQFDPRTEFERVLEDLDVIGFLDAYPEKDIGGGLVNPRDGKRGYLKEREYKIVRAVYHYNCSYCIDTSDYGYIVLEDKEGNRFKSSLDMYGISSVKYGLLGWDEILPYYLADGKALAELVDVE